MDPSQEETVELKSEKLGQAGKPVPTADGQVTEGVVAVRLAELLLLGLSDTEATDGLRSSSSRWIGKLVGDYRLEEELGRGGMGIVFRAVNMRVGSTVALKLLRFAPGESAERLRRFETEARAAAALNHPNIINVYDVGQVNDLYYLAMEYVEGRPLSELIASGPLDPQQTVRIASDVCNALEFAHEAGVIHRDIKPSNILIEKSGRAQLMDFGLARSMDAGKNPRKLTEAGSILGTVHYMSPEQARGQSHLADSRSDICSVGAVLYEMSTGHVAYEGETLLEIAHKVACEEPVPPRKLRPSIDRDLQIIILKAMEKDPARRYRSALALREDLGRYHDGEPILARAPSLTYRTKKWLVRHRTFSVPVGLLLAGLLTAAAWVKVHDQHVVARLGAATDETVRQKLFEIEEGALRDPERERWKLLHALRLSGKPKAAWEEFALLEHPAAQADPGRAAEFRLWSGVLKRESGLPDWEQELEPLMSLALTVDEPWITTAAAAYLGRAAPSALETSGDAKAKLEYHLGLACCLRGEPAQAVVHLRHAQDTGSAVLEARCAAVELRRMEK